MVRFIFLIVALISLIYGLVFSLNPYWFVNLTMAENTNIAWLRTIGSSNIGLLFFGCMSIYLKPVKKIGILKLITITSILQTLTLIYSRFYNEFSAQKLPIIDLTIFLAIFVCIYFLWVIRYKSYQFK